MHWFLTENDVCVQIYLVDDKFNRPKHWSYRYFWRLQAKGNAGGLSVNHVGAIADEAARICNVTL